MNKYILFMILSFSDSPRHSLVHDTLCHSYVPSQDRTICAVDNATNEFDLDAGIDIGNAIIFSYTPGADQILNENGSGVVIGRLYNLGAVTTLPNDVDLAANFSEHWEVLYPITSSSIWRAIRMRFPILFGKASLMGEVRPGRYVAGLFEGDFTIFLAGTLTVLALGMS